MYSDPDFCRIVPNMSWIRNVVSVSLDPNRSAFINFVHGTDNSRSLHVVDGGWRWCMEGEGECRTPCKKGRGNCPGGTFRGTCWDNMSRENIGITFPLTIINRV